MNTRSPSTLISSSCAHSRPGHVADDVAAQEDVEVVLGVEREVVLDQQAAACAERQPLDVLALRKIGRRSKHRDDRASFRDRRPRGVRSSRTRRGTARARRATRAGRPQCCRSRSPRRRPAGIRTRRSAEPSKSRTALPYSARFKRWIDARPGFGLARHSRVERRREPVHHAMIGSGSGRGMPCGGIAPALSLRTTRSQISGRRPRARSRACRARRRQSWRTGCGRRNSTA